MDSAPNRRRSAFASAFSALGFAFLALALYYALSGLSADTWDYSLPRRIKVLAGISLVAVSVGMSAVVFQTVAANHILTPGIMGLDSLYVFLQTLVIYFCGSGGLGEFAGPPQFVATVALMSGACALIFVLMFRRRDGSVYHAVLVGIVFGIAFEGMSKFMQVIIDPSEFSVLEGRMFASFNRINVGLLGISAAAVAAAALWMLPDFRNLDALTLGRSQSVALGVDYRRVVLKSIVAVAVLTSASTALVGPVTFLGIIVASLARFIFPTYRHGVLVPGAILAGLCVLTFGMLVTERVLNFAVPLGVVINFAGGIYFIYLMLKYRSL